MNNTTTNVQGKKPFTIASNSPEIRGGVTGQPFEFPDPEYIQNGPEPMAGITNAQDLNIWEERVEAIKKKRISYKSELEKMKVSRDYWRGMFWSFIGVAVLAAILSVIYG